MNDFSNRCRAFINSLIRTVVAVIVFLLFVYLLKVSDLSFVISFSYIPKASMLLAEFVSLITDYSFYQNVLWSVYRVYVGFLIALMLAVPTAILVNESSIVRYLLMPIIELIRPIPNAAWVPLSILLFTSTSKSVLFITFIGAFFPILINTIEGLKNINFNYIRIAKSFDISKMAMIFEVKLPAAGPNIFTGILLGMSGSWLGVVVAEMMNGESGIGYLTWVNYTLCNISGVIICMMFIGLLGAISSIFIKMIFKKMHFGEGLNESSC